MIYWLVDHVRFLFCSSFSGWEWPQGKNSSKLRTKSWITRYRILYNQSCICRIVLFMNLFSLVWFCVLYVCAVDASIFSICIVLFLLMWSIRWKISKFIRSVGESYLLIYILFYVSFSNLQSSSSLRSIGNCFAFLLPFLFIVFFIFCWMIRHCRLWRARTYECVCVCSSSDQRTDDDEPWTGAAISFFISEFFFFVLIGISYIWYVRALWLVELLGATHRWTMMMMMVTTGFCDVIFFRGAMLSILFKMSFHCLFITYLLWASFSRTHGAKSILLE